MIRYIHLSITLLSALACSAANEEPVQKLRIGLRQPGARMAKLRKGELPPPPPPAPTCDTTCEGLGENPGVPNLEYLGLGYNIFEGNPRGSDISEADPGFRSGVIKLVQKQTTLTVDQDYMVPLGVDLRYVTACKFASKSTELSNESQYQSEISQEASQETEINAGANYGMFSVSASYAFSESQKYKQFVETTSNTQTVEFEARALCSEFKAALTPYYTHSLKEEFEKALNSLSIGWENTDDQRKEYADFISAYGTHYIKDVTLGAKHIYSSAIKYEDVATLSRNEIDISSTLSWSAQASFGGGGGGDPTYGALPRIEAEGEIPGLGTGKMFKYVFEDQGVGGGASSTQTNSEASSQSSLEQVRSKVTTINELNVGGNPPEDGNWKTWATTVRDKPMPVSYELAGLWTLMSDNQTETFYNATIDLYGFNLERKKDSAILNAMRFGVTRGDAKAISSYNQDPSSTYRSNVQLDKKMGASGDDIEQTTSLFKDVSDKEMDLPNECGDKAKWSGWTGLRLPPDHTKMGGKEQFACGMKAYATDDVLDGLDIHYCTLNDWGNLEDREGIEVRTQIMKGGNADTRGWVNCPENTFITGIKGMVETRTGEAFKDVYEGMTQLIIKCKSPGDPKGEPQTSTIFTDSDGVLTKELDRTNPDTFLTGVNVRSCQRMGFIDMALRFEAPKATTDPSASYKYDISRESAGVPAIFATPVRGSVGVNTEEDEREFGFSFEKSSGEKVFNVLSSYPFGEFVGSKAQIVIRDFKSRLINENNLQAFSFLSGINLPENADYVAGVVHPDGYPMNDVFRDNDIGYKIAQISGQEYKIEFTDKNFTEAGEAPTFLAFPLWFPGPYNSFPKQIGDVVVATKECTVQGCRVATGTKNNYAAKKNLGFSFIALKSTLKAENVHGIVHGVIKIGNSENGNAYITDVTQQSDYKFEMKPRDDNKACANGCKLGVGNSKNKGTFTFKGKTGGVLITFENPFRGLPSVIVSPIIEERTILEGSSIDQFALPYAIVEHISEESAFVKVYWLDTMGKAYGSEVDDVEQMSFHFVAVGPQRDPYKKDGSLITTSK